jgi:hypothetical protein
MTVSFLRWLIRLHPSLLLFIGGGEEVGSNGGRSDHSLHDSADINACWHRCNHARVLLSYYTSTTVLVQGCNKYIIMFPTNNV